MNGKAIVVLTVLILAVALPGVYLLGAHRWNANAAYNCTAGPGTTNPNDLCANEAFYRDTLRLKVLQTELEAGKKKAALSGDYPLWLQEKQDQYDGMQARLVKLLPRNPKTASAVNPEGITHVWDERVNRLVPYVPIPPFDASAPKVVTPTPTPVPAPAPSAKPPAKKP